MDNLSTTSWQFSGSYGDRWRRRKSPTTRMSELGPGCVKTLTDTTIRRNVSQFLLAYPVTAPSASDVTFLICLVENEVDNFDSNRVLLRPFRRMGGQI